MTNKDSLALAHQEMSRKKAVGVDQVTKDEYANNLGENLDALTDRMK